MYNYSKWLKKKPAKAATSEKENQVQKGYNFHCILSFWIFKILHCSCLFFIYLLGGSFWPSDFRIILEMLVLCDINSVFVFYICTMNIAKYLYFVFNLTKKKIQSTYLSMHLFCTSNISKSAGGDNAPIIPESVRSQPSSLSWIPASHPRFPEADTLPPKSWWLS